MNVAYTICSANYLPYAKLVADSLIQHNPDYHFVIALADTYSNFDKQAFFPHHVVPITHMSIANLDEMNDRYDIFELSCALKPSVAKYILQENTACQKLFYFDSDIMLFGALSAAENILDTNAVVLTPHITKAAPYNESNSTEQNVLKTGLYNAGFFGISNCGESRAFLQWWEERLRYQCFNNADHGLFVDQIWLNLVPLCFKNVRVLYHPGYNVAYWNFSERILTQTNENAYWVNGTYPLVFFHFSGYSVYEPELVSKHNPTLLMLDVPAYASVFDVYSSNIRNSSMNYLFALPNTLGKQLPVQQEVVVPKRNRFKSLFSRKH